MKPFKFFWNTHKWTGIVLGLILVNLAVTGFFLLAKKDYAWIQPPNQQAASGNFEDCLSIRELLDAVLAEKHPDLLTEDDIARIDFRPSERLHKVKSKHNYSEIQICAITGEVLSAGVRNSDWLERLHDGSLFGGWVHGWVMPLVACALLFMVVSGYYIWLAPIISKRRRQKKPTITAD